MHNRLGATKPEIVGKFEDLTKFICNYSTTLNDILPPDIFEVVTQFYY